MITDKVGFYVVYLIHQFIKVPRSDQLYFLISINFIPREEGTDLEECRYRYKRNTSSPQSILQQNFEESESDDLSDDESIERVTETTSED